MKNEFDSYADTYYEEHTRNVKITGESPRFFAEYKIKDLKEICEKESIIPKNILDFGTGIGNSIPFLRMNFPDTNLTCCDISTKCLDVASSRFPRQAKFIQNNNLKHFNDASFDIIYTACVFHHIPQNQHAEVLKEQKRLLRCGGLLFIYEHNPLNPLVVHAVNTCPLDKNAILIKASIMAERIKCVGLTVKQINFRLFFPHCLRILRTFEKFLTWLPLGAQYYIVATKN